MRILVTGAAGFIGAHVVSAVAGKGHEVFAAVRNGKTVKSQRRDEGDIQSVPLDLDDDACTRSAVNQICPDVTIHLAWYAVPGKYWTAPANLDCVRATLNLAQVLSEVRCNKLVVAGSCAEYDCDYGFLSEECTPLSPRTLYGTCKNGLREILESFCSESSVQLAWTRLFYLYGPGEHAERFVPSIILPLLHGQTAKCTCGEQIRDFLHVEDVADAISTIACSDFTGAVNIGSGQPLKIKAIGETIARIIGCRDHVAFGALAENPSEPPLLVADVRKLNRSIGWKPSRTLEAGLLQTVDWWRANS